MSHGVAIAQLKPCPNTDPVSPYVCYNEQELWDALLARKPKPYEPNCQSPQGRDDADLCAQRRMAEAAEELTALTRGQIIIGGLTLAGLIATILITLKATNAAEASVAIAQDTAKRQLRAYISMSPQELGGLVPGGRVRVQFRPINHGETPAYNLRHDVGMGVFIRPVPDDLNLPTTFQVRTENAIYPDSDTDVTWFDWGKLLTQEQVDLIGAGRAEFRCWGKTTFRDSFNKERRINFNVAVTGREVVEAMAAAKAGKKENLPNWRWLYRRGHNSEDEV
jgi:hypothetical protein